MTSSADGNGIGSDCSPTKENPRALRVPDPAIGQVWQSWDVRERPLGGGYLRIVELFSNGVRCERVRRLPGGGFERYGNANVMILNRRLRPNASGYRLVEDKPEPIPADSAEGTKTPSGGPSIRQGRAE